MPRRLRIVRAHLQGFGPHRDTTLDLSPGITNLVGRFGTGKSFVAEAIRYALEGTTLRPYAYDPTVGGGPPAPTKVELDLLLDGEESLTVARSPSGSSHSKQSLYETLGIREASRTAKDDITLLDVLLNPQRFFEVGEDARLRFIDRAFGDPLTIGEMEAEKVTDPDIQKACLRSLKAGAAAATKARRDAERLAEAALSRRPDDEEVEVLGNKKRLSEVDADSYRTKLAPAKTKRDENRAAANRALGALTRPDPRKEHSEAVSKAREAKEAAEEAYKAFAVGPSAKKAREAKDILASAENMVNDAKNEIADLERESDPCPTCGANRNLSEIAALHSAISEAKDRGAEAKRTLEAHAVEERRLKKAVADATETLDDLTETAPAAPEAPSMTKEEAEALLAKADSLDAQIQEVEALIARVVAYRGAVKALEESEKRRDAFLKEASRYQKHEDGIERLVKKRGMGPLPKVQEKVKNVSERLGFDCALTERGEVLVRGMAIETASRGQRLYAGLVVGAAIASLSGVGFLFLDDFASVDGPARLTAFKLLLATVKGENPMLEQVFLVSLPGFEKVTAPAAAVKEWYRVWEFTGIGEVEEVK